ncbi:MAG: 2-amino-4-ketopentanoate thiolase [Firmicutes bacterium]|nr:2-amino-4-ketopentanoate thiolase [Bacillota bacterium]
MVKKGTWVLVKKVVLLPEERPLTLPKDTLKTPLLMWIKGHLLEDASLGNQVQIKTLTGRLEQGELIEVQPTYRHDFGDFVPELQIIDNLVKAELFGGETSE